MSPPVPLPDIPATSLLTPVGLIHAMREWRAAVQASGRRAESLPSGEVARRAGGALRDRLRRIRALFGSVFAAVWHVTPWCRSCPFVIPLHEPFKKCHLNYCSTSEKSVAVLCPQIPAPPPLQWRMPCTAELEPCRRARGACLTYVTV